MAVSDANALLLQVSADIKGLEKAFNRANGIVDDGSKRMVRSTSLAVSTMEKSFAGLKLPRHLEREFENLGAGIGRGLQRASTAAQIALGAISAYSIKLAADAAEIESAFDVAFKGSSQSARDFANVLTTKLGRDAVETREAMTRLQLVLTGTGVAAEQATELTKKLTEVGVDAGSLFNTSDAESFQKIISGISGEAEPLKAFGVVINEAAVKAELLRLGFKGTASDASEAAKSIARANLIIKGLAVAQGDAERTAGSAANKAKALRAEFNATARDLGTQLLPAFIKLAGGATDLLKAFGALPGGIQVASLALLGLVAAAGPIASVATGLIRLIKLAKETQVAIAGIGAANAAAGAAGGAGAAAGALGGAGLAAAGVATGGVGLIVGGSALVLSQRDTALQRSRKAPGKASVEDLNAAISEANKLIEQALKSGGNERGDAVQGRRRDIAALSAELKRRQAKPVGTASPTAPDTANAFTLSDLQKIAAGGAGAKGKAAPRDVTDERAAQVAAQYAAASADLLAATADLATDIQTRANLEKQIIGQQAKIEDERLNGQIASIADDKGISKETKNELTTQLEAVRAKNAEVTILRERLVDQQAQAMAVRQALDIQEQQFDQEGDLLNLKASLATATGEQQKLAIQMVDLAYRRAKAELESALAVEGISKADRELLQRKLDALNKNQPAVTAAARADAASRTPGGSAGIAAFQDPREQGPLSDKFNADAKAAIDASVEARQLLTDDEAERTRIAQEGADARARIDEVAYEARMQFASDFFGNLASLSGSSNKTLAAIGKAAAITQATIDGVLAVQKALATYPPPFNYVAAAGVGVAAAVNVAKIAGLKDGGEVTGMGGPRDDSELRRLSVGEFVVNARDAQRNKALLMSINAGRVPNLTPAPFLAGGSSTTNTSNTFAPTLNVSVSGASVANPGRTGRQIAAETMRSFDSAQRRGFVNG